ncbi:MAG: hypothetical protein HRU36_04925 [Rickettsiales bacterium]|nr:hypothetical protein [Rickettsiales bacterium]
MTLLIILLITTIILLVLGIKNSYRQNTNKEILMQKVIIFLEKNEGNYRTS